MSLEIRDCARDWDVIVVGGGTAGAIAGISAVRAGARVLIVEAFGSLGGTGTNAQVTPLMRNVSSGQNLNRGLTDELKRRLIARGDGAVDANGNDNWFNPEAMKLILEEMFLEHGGNEHEGNEHRGEVLYHTHFVSSELENGFVNAVIVHNKDGLLRLRARAFVDATGDADLAVRAGAPFDAGEAETGLHQAMSLRFMLAGCDLERVCAFLREEGQPQESAYFVHTWMVWGRGSALEPLFRRAVEDGVLLERDGDYFQAFSVPGMSGVLSFNCPRLAAELNDGADAWTLSMAQIDGRRAIERLLGFCRRYIPGCESSFIASYAAMPGVRETRRIRGEYTLELTDILECRTFEDAICRNHYPVDIHTPGASRLRHERSGPWPYFAPDAFHEIPYRCLIPLGLENVLVAGRSASSSFEAQSAIRVQQNCHSMGEAAGLASAWMSLRGLRSREIDGRALRTSLRELGANV